VDNLLIILVVPILPSNDLLLCHFVCAELSFRLCRTVMSPPAAIFLKAIKKKGHYPKTKKTS